MTDKKNKLLELHDELNKIREDQAEKEEGYRKLNMTGCIGTLENLATYQKKCEKIEKEIEKFQNYFFAFYS